MNIGTETEKQNQIVENIVEVTRHWDNDYGYYWYTLTVFGGVEERYVNLLPNWGVPQLVNGKHTPEINASPEMIEQYKAKKAKEARHKEACYLVEHRKYVHKTRKKAQITLKELRKLENVYNGKELSGVLKLLQTKNFRSDFRKSLNDQVRAWLKETEPKYHRPLSERQLECL